MLLARIHFWFGFSGVIIFLLTGQYMEHTHNQLADMADGPRMLYRSAHIYILLAFLINLFLGVYFKSEEKTVVKALQILVSVLVLVAPVLFLAGFFLEADYALEGLVRPYSKMGSYMLFAAGILLGLQVFFSR